MTKPKKGRKVARAPTSRQRLEDVCIALRMRAERAEERTALILDAVGVPLQPSEAGVIIALTTIREDANNWRTVLDVAEGSFNADEALRRRIACALGTSSVREAGLLARAAELARSKAEGYELRALLQEARERAAKLEDQLQDYGARPDA